MAPRVIFAMARNGLFWRGATEVNKGGTPDVALLISALVSAAFIVWSDRFSQVIAVLAFFFVANYTLSFAAVFALRRRAPDAPRPYRAWGHPLTTALALAASVAFLVGAVLVDRRNSIYALVVLASRTVKVPPGSRVSSVPPVSPSLTGAVRGANT
jgi:APA family basic amino acid/polyamine antiporter